MPPTQVPCGPVQSQLEVQGVLKGQYAYREKEVEGEVNIVKGLKIGFAWAPSHYSTTSGRETMLRAIEG